MATKNETLISELKINYLTEELYAEALANGQINNDEIYMTPGSDLSIYATKEELENKADEVHTHEISDINELQSKLDEKQKTITGAATTIANSNLTTNRALVSNGSGKVVVSAVTSTELGYLDGVTANVQTQLDGKASDSHTHDEYATKTELNDKADGTHTHDEYLPLAGGIMTGSITTPASDSMGIMPKLDNFGQIGSSDKKFYRMYASTFNGSLKGNADTATKATQATQDGSGNVITSTYATKTELNSVPNLHVWKRYTSDPSIPAETNVSNQEIAYSMNLGTVGYTLFSVEYADSAQIVDGYVTLVEPISTLGISYSSATSSDFEVLRGKYIYGGNLVSKGYYYIPTNATFTVSGTSVKVNSANKLFKPTIYDCVGSTASNTYPTSGQHTDGYWYEYNNKLGHHTHSEYANVKHIHDEYMASTNPTGTGSLSIGRRGDVGNYSATLGNNCLASGEFSLAFGSNSQASAERSVAIGNNALASGQYAVAIGVNGISSNSVQYNGAIGDGSVMLGYACESTGNYSFSTGQFNRASGANSQAFGYQITALRSQHAQGHYNDTSKATAGSTTGTTGTAFVIGNGTSSSASNACRITYAGAVIGKAAYQSTGADYAEYFEWADGNVDNEERIGYFVTFDDGEFIRKANEDEYILGIVSGNPAVLGNNDECWRGQNEMDEWNRFIYVTETNEETGETYETYKVNPEYDSTLQYIPRADRPEWDAVGMLGVLSVRDDGTCKVNGYCKVADGGIATASDTGYRVIKRVTDNIIKVVFR